MPKGVGVIAVSVVPTKSMKFCAFSGLGAYCQYYPEFVSR